MKKFAYQETNYPEIFKNIYWGMFEAREFPQEIYNNRNKLIEEFNILKAHSGQSFHKFFHPDLDHKEVYLTKENKVILLYSNYNENMVVPSNYDGTVLLSGFHEHVRVYHPRAVTCIKVFKNPKAFREYCRSIKQMAIEENALAC